MNKLFKITSLMLIVCCFQNSIAQTIQYSPEDTPQGIPILPVGGHPILFDNAEIYIPYGPSGSFSMNNQPVKTINVAFHIFQASDGHGNFQNTTADRQFLVALLNQMNNNYSSGAPSDPVPGITQLPNYDSKIRFSLGTAGQERIYFYQDDTCYNSGYSGEAMRDYLKNNFPDRYNNFYNVYFAEGYYWVTLTSFDVTNKGSGYTSAPTVVFSPDKAAGANGFRAEAVIVNGKVDTIIITENKIFKDWPADLPLPKVTLVGGGGSGATAVVNVSLGANGYASSSTVLLQIKSRWWPTFGGDLLSHEIGHSFSLNHIFSPGICNHVPYYYDIFGYNLECPHIVGWDTVSAWINPNDRICNNILNYGPELHYISPLQAGEMHMATTKGNIGKFVQETYINSPLVIDNLTQPTYDLRLFCDIILAANTGKLEIIKNLILPSSAKITVNNGSILTFRQGSLLDFDNTPFDGEIIVKAGGKILIDAYTALSLGGTGKITIEQGGSLECVYNGSIKLEDQSSLRVNGDILMSGNIVIAGTGYLFLNGNLNANPGSNFTFLGSDKNTKLMDIQKSVTISNNFSNVNLSRGKIVMANTTSELIFNNPTSTVTFNSILVTSVTGSYLACNGVRLNNVPNITVTNSTFEKVKYGLYLSLTATDPVASITGSTFQNCNTGLMVYHSGATILNSNFNGNTTYGVNGLSNEKPMNLYNSTIQNNSSYGVCVTGTASTTVKLDGCIVSSNANGVQVSGPLTLDVDCGSVSYNTTYGVFLTSNAIIDADYASLNNNKINIYGYGPTTSTSYNSFSLAGGENDLTDNGATGSWCMNGRFWAFTGGAVDVNNNKWKAGGGAPVNGTDYSLTGSSSAITLSDNSPNSILSTCPAIGSNSTLMATSGNTQDYTYQNVTTSLGTMKLNTTVEGILNNDPAIGTVYDNYTRFNLLHQLMANKLRNPNMGEKWYFEKGYSEMKALLGKPVKDESETYNASDLQKMRGNARSMGANRKKWHGERATVEFRALIDEAYLLAFESRYDEAITLLQANQYSFAADDAAYLDVVICRLNVDKAIASGNYTLAVDEEYARCERCETEKSGSINDNSSEITTGASPESERFESSTSLNIVPNPVNGISDIEICLPTNAGATTLIVFNSAGQKIMEQTIDQQNCKIQINKSTIPAGLYLVNLVVDGKTVAAKKMVVMQ